MTDDAPVSNDNRYIDTEDDFDFMDDHCSGDMKKLPVDIRTRCQKILGGLSGKPVENKILTNESNDCSLPDSNNLCNGAKFIETTIFAVLTVLYYQI